jgi:cytochrome c peroxidase
MSRPVRVPRRRPSLALAALLGCGAVLAALRGSADLAADGAPGGVPGARTREEALVELGRRLFFDPVASRSGARSCASCHDPEHGFSDPAVRSADDAGRTARHSQTLLDGHLNPTAHWDGEFDTIEELVTARLGAPSGVRGSAGRGAHGPLSEFGADPGLVAILDRPARGGGGYGPPTTGPRQPPREPGDPEPGEPDDGDDDGDEQGGDADEGGEAPPPETDAKAEKPAPGSDVGDRAARRARAEASARVLPLDLTKLADVAATIESHGRYADLMRAAYDSDSVTTSRLAESIAAYCRTIRSTEAPFDRFRAGERSALSASAQRGFDLFRGRAGCAQCHLVAGQRPTFTDFQFHNTGIAQKTADRRVEMEDGVLAERAAMPADEGRGGVTRSSSQRRAFKTPTLRDLTRRGPYMHDGSLETLADVVRHYAAGGAKDKRLDGKLHAFEASDQDVADLVAFLESLTGDERPGTAPRAWHARAERQRVRLLDARRRPLAGLEVALAPEGDILPIDDASRGATPTVESDAEGWIEFAPSCRTHVRLGLPEGLLPEGGPLIPDACREAVVSVPVDGRVTLMVLFAQGEPAPPRLVAEHELTMRLPGHAAPRTLLERVSEHVLGGRAAATYTGWRRTDVPPSVILRLPGDGRGRAEHRLTLDAVRTQKLDLGS